MADSWFTQRTRATLERVAANDAPALVRAWFGEFGGLAATARISAG